MLRSDAGQPDPKHLDNETQRCLAELVSHIRCTLTAASTQHSFGSPGTQRARELQRVCRQIPTCSATALCSPAQPAQEPDAGSARLSHALAAAAAVDVHALSEPVREALRRTFALFMRYQQVYRATDGRLYGAGAGAPRVLRGAFLCLCKRCGLLRAAALSAPRAAAVFDATAGSSADGSAPRGLGLAGFATALTAVAALMHRELPAAQALQRICESHIVHCEATGTGVRPAPPCAALLADLYAAFSVSTQHRAWLGSLFRIYAAAAPGEARLKQLSLSMDGLKQMCKDLSISPRLLTSQAVCAAFDNAMWRTGTFHASDLCFEEFIDAMLHVAMAAGGFTQQAAGPVLHFTDAYSTAAKQMWLRSQCAADAAVSREVCSWPQPVNSAATDTRPLCKSSAASHRVSAWGQGQNEDTALIDAACAAAAARQRAHRDAADEALLAGPLQAPAAAGAAVDNGAMATRAAPQAAPMRVASFPAWDERLRRAQPECIGDAQVLALAPRSLGATDVPPHLRAFSIAFMAEPRGPLATPQPTGAAQGIPWLPASGVPGHVAEGVRMSDERYGAMMAALLDEWRAAVAARGARLVELETLRQQQQERLRRFQQQRKCLQARCGQAVAYAAAESRG